MCPLVLGEILGVLVSTLTADPKYPVQDCTNLQVPIQMQLSEKRETFSGLFVPFLEATSNSKSFEKKQTIVIPNVFPKLQTLKMLVRPPSKKRHLRTRFDSQHIKSIPNTCEIPMRALLSCYFIIVRKVDLKNVSPSVR